MSKATEQQVTFFGTPVNVLSLAKIRHVRSTLARLTGRDHAYLVGAWYLQMRDLAKQGTTFAQFTTNTVHLVDAIGVERPRDHDPELLPWVEAHGAVWDAFKDADLIDTDGDMRSVDELYRVEVLDFEQTNVHRATRATTKRERAPMTVAERSAKTAENKRRVATGMERMSDQEAESWLAQRRNSREPHTPRHATLEETDKRDSERGVPVASTEYLLQSDENIRQIEAEEKYLPGHLKTGANRDDWTRGFVQAAPPLHDGEHLVANAFDNPPSNQDEPSTDAPTTPNAGSQPREAVTTDTAA